MIRVIRVTGDFRVIEQGGRKETGKKAGRGVIVPVGVTHHRYDEEQHLTQVGEELIDARRCALGQGEAELGTQLIHQRHL
jgi:hypothetical protein